MAENIKEPEKIIVFNSIGDELRVGLLEDYVLAEIFFEDMESTKNSGKIFVGRIENDVPSLEAFFVNIGINKNGFLRYKDLIGIPSDYKKGDFLIVQVKKDGNVRKGPQLSMQINLPGRYIVYMPYGESSIGISKKITSLHDRERLREIGEELIYETEGIIFRTNCQGIDGEIIRDELKGLRDEWRKICLLYKSAQKPVIAFSDEDFVEYLLRERVDKTTKKIVTDSQELYEKIEAFFEYENVKMPVEFSKKDSFMYMGVYSQLDDVFARKITLSNGGTITIDRTEAMTVVDVDSASNIQGKNIEETSFQTNMSAAKEIVRQMRLRNISGIIIIDFIDMSDASHKEKIIELINHETLKDKAKVTVVGFTNLGLLEMTRKKTNVPIDNFLYSQCPVCHGTGRVASPRIIFDRLIKDVKDSLSDMKEYNIKEVFLSLHHNLSGYATPEVKNELEEKFDVKIKFEFNWSDPNSYNLRFKK